MSKVKIEIEEKDLEFLLKLGDKLATQDNKMTASPFAYTLIKQGEGNLGRHNFFLTEDAANKFLEENEHNYGEGWYPYLFHAYRNEEIENLIDIIVKLTGRDIRRD